VENYTLYFDHAPDAGLDDKFEFSSAPYRRRKSTCFLASAGRLTCTTCHNPHDVRRGALASAQYSQACRGCHGGLSKLHPAADECISCHMPKRRPSDATHVTVMDHFIRKRPTAVWYCPTIPRSGAYPRQRTLRCRGPGNASGSPREFRYSKAPSPNPRPRRTISTWNSLRPIVTMGGPPKQSCFTSKPPRARPPTGVPLRPGKFTRRHRRAGARQSHSRACHRARAP
jgi:predicted CXXCH cytochrome family protein